MRLTNIAFLLGTLLLTSALEANPVLTLNPITGVIGGLPGQTIGWGFILTSSTTDYISVTGTFFDDSSPAVGTFDDFISAQGGPEDAVLAPGASAWKESFNEVSQQGLGSFEISTAALPGQVDKGTITVFFDEFSANPNTCGSCYIDSSSVNADFVVNVGTATPEPGALALLVLGFLTFGLNSMKALQNIARAIT